jgi:hypothetical protein
VDLIRGFGSDEFSQALESWRWIGIEGKTPLFCSPFGDVFLRAADGIWWLDTAEGTLTRRWAHSEELKAALRTTEGQDRFLLAGLAVAAERQGIVPGARQVYGFKIAQVLGGQLNVDNLEVIDFVVGINILGHIHEQVRNLPQGTRISGFSVQPADSHHDEQRTDRSQDLSHADQPGQQALGNLPRHYGPYLRMMLTGPLAGGISTPAPQTDPVPGIHASARAALTMPVLCGTGSWLQWPLLS